MILKKMKRTNFEKPKATMIAALVDYIFAEKDENGKAKLMYSGALNFLTTTLAAQKNEMIALAEESVQSKMPVAHWILSWQENELPSHEQIDEAVNIFLERMGLSEHQAFYTLHGNTGNHHVHIAVNRTHPYTMKTVQPHRGFDIEEGHRIVAVIAHKQGWEIQKNARYRINEKGEVVRNIRTLPFIEQPPVIKPVSRAEDFESATGEKSAMRIAQERGRKIILTAKSWKELHEQLAMVGLRFEGKGSGAVVFVGDTAVKASSIDRNFGLSKLCKRLGEFEAGDYQTDELPKITPEPVSLLFTEEWREYRQVRSDEAKRRNDSRKCVVADMRRIRERQREQRREKLSALAPHGLSILNIARHYLKKQQQEERQRERTLTPAHNPLGTFRAWLRQQKGNLRANRWRFRRRIPSGMKLKKLEFPQLGDISAPYTAYREMVKRRFPEKLDESSLDMLVALYMRCAGYKDRDIGAGILQEAKPLRQEREHRNWRDYAQRIVNYAFQTPGNIEITAFNPTPEIIQKLHQKAREIEAERLEAARMPEPEREAPRLRMR